ncbi:MAG: XRE family transcriptional regulator [Methylorubrum populi]
MGRTLNDVIAVLPEQRRTRVEARFQELKDEVEGLGELRRAAGKAQAEVAMALKIKQPSVSKIEKQTDMYLSTLRSYVRAIGGDLDLVVRLPSRAPIHLQTIGDIGACAITSKLPRAKRAKGRTASPRAVKAG